jgi:hypothetical protein
MKARLARALSRCMGAAEGVAAIGGFFDIGIWATALRPGGVILFEGTSRARNAIKSFVQLIRLHAARYEGPMPHAPCPMLYRKAQGLAPSAGAGFERFWLSCGPESAVSSGFFLICSRVWHRLAR